ncbi:MAG: hypothetical protein ACFFFB_06880 [Candidatus Heimdallarchaeota archaeon]
MNQNRDKEKENTKQIKDIELNFTSKVEISSEDNFDWDWIFDKGWLRIKK